MVAKVPWPHLAHTPGIPVQISGIPPTQKGTFPPIKPSIKNAPEHIITSDPLEHKNQSRNMRNVNKVGNMICDSPKGIQ